MTESESGLLAKSHWQLYKQQIHRQLTPDNDHIQSSCYKQDERVADKCTKSAKVYAPVGPPPAGGAIGIWCIGWQRP